MFALKPRASDLHPLFGVCFGLTRISSLGCTLGSALASTKSSGVSAQVSFNEIFILGLLKNPSLSKDS